MELTRFNKFSRSVKYMLIQHAFNLLSGIFVGAMIARHYGPELFAVFSISIFYVSVVNVIAALGTNDLLAAQCIKKPHLKEGLFWAVLIIRFLAYLSCAAFGYLLLLYFKVDDIIIRGYNLGLVAGLIANINLFGVIAKSKQRNDKIAQFAIVGLFGSIAFRVFIVLTSKSLDYLYYNLALVALIDLLLMIWYLKAEKMIYSFAKPNWVAASKLIFNAAPVATGATVTLIGGSMALVFMEELMGYDAAGNYAVVLKLYTFAAFFAHVLYNNLFYYMESSGLTADKFIGQHLKVIVKSTAALSYLLIIGAFLAIAPILEVLYGEQYRGVGMKFALASTNFLFGWASIPAQIKLLSEKRTGRIMAIDVICLVTNVVGAYVLISMYGEWGAYFLMPLTALILMIANYCLSGLGKEIKGVFLWFLSPIPSREALKNFTKH